MAELGGGDLNVQPKRISAKEPFAEMVCLCRKTPLNPPHGQFFKKRGGFQNPPRYRISENPAPCFPLPGSGRVRHSMEMGSVQLIAGNVWHSMVAGSAWDSRHWAGTVDGRAWYCAVDGMAW